MTISPTSPSGDRASALAERFGMTRDAVEELMQQTHSEYPTAAQPPVEPRAEVPIERAADILRPTAPSTVAEPPPSTPARQSSKPLSGGFIAAMFIVLLIGLGIVASFRQGCFARRTGTQAPVPTDTIAAMMQSAKNQASSPPVPPSPVAPGQVPPEALIVPREEPPKITKPPIHTGITTEVQALRAEAKPVPKPVLVTPSNFEAEEELARLHAEGMSRSYLSAVHRRNGVTYRVYERR